MVKFLVTEINGENTVVSDAVANVESYLTPDDFMMKMIESELLVYSKKVDEYTRKSESVKNDIEAYHRSKGSIVHVEFNPYGSAEQVFGKMKSVQDKANGARSHIGSTIAWALLLPWQSPLVIKNVESLQYFDVFSC